MRRTVQRVMLPWVIVSVLAGSFSAAGAGFTNVTTVVLQQGAVPTRNGEPIAGAPVYSGCEDTYTDSANPNTCYLDSTSLYAGGTAARRSFIRFNLAPYIPSGCAIVSAELVFTSEGETEWLAANSGIIQALTSAWATNLTWNNDPGLSGPNVGFYMHSYWGWAVWAAGSTITQDLTHTMQAWVRGQHPNHGFRIIGPSGACTMRRVSSANHGTIASRPKLTVRHLEFAKRVFTREGIFRNDIYVLSGWTNIEDTCVDVSAQNYSTNSILGNIKTTHNGGDTYAPRRALYRVMNTNPPLSKLLISTNPAVPGRPRLMGAQLNIALMELSDQLYFWDCSQTWASEVVSGQTRDGTNPWAEVWTNTAISNVGYYYGRFNYNHRYLGSTFSWDITAALQRYADGSPNTGFLLGQPTGAEYWTRVFAVEYGIPWLGPTCVVQTWTKLYDGTCFQLR